jgi:hypothetical protein
LHPLDGYLLTGRPGKAEAIAAALAARSDDPRAQPFYRALATVGTNAADDALLALRLVLGGHTPDDAGVRAARAARAEAQAGRDPDYTTWLQTVGMIRA